MQSKKNAESQNGAVCLFDPSFSVCVKPCLEHERFGSILMLRGESENRKQTWDCSSLSSSGRRGVVVILLTKPKSH